MEWIINQLRVHPELAIFLTLFAGFWLGRLKIGKLSICTVNSVLLVGVLVGQLNITVDGPLIAGRLTNDICRYRRGKRYDQPVGHQRSTEGNIY